MAATPAGAPSLVGRTSGFRDSDRARRDPDFGRLHGEPELERLYPQSGA